MNALARPSSKRGCYVNTYTDYDRRCSIEKKNILVVNLKGLGAKTN
jgi:hypothetical protein